MHKIWPNGKIPYQWQRTELNDIKNFGYTWNDPYDVVKIFENKVAEFSGSKYAVAVDCCSHGLFLCLKYLKASGKITIPKKTYLSVPMQINHAGCDVVFEDRNWKGKYQLLPYPIWDAAVQWKPNMYAGGFHVLSFQIKKPIPIGRGGMILTDDYNAAIWLKKASHDGRDLTVSYHTDKSDIVGWHYYMTPEDAARGILLMDNLNRSDLTELGSDNYLDISAMRDFK